MRARMEGVLGVAVEAILHHRSTSSGVAHEIEARLGRMEGKHFVSGVNPKYFDVLLQRLELCDAWASQDGWRESEDSTFEDPHGRQVRQTRTCNTRECRIELSAIHKDRKASACVALARQATEEDSPFALIPTGVDAMRVSYATETPVKKESLPQLVRPLHVRIKQRRSFTLPSTALEGAAWRFDLTRTWSGSAREEAERRQHEEPPVCEVELEWVPPLAAVAQPPSVALTESLANSIRSKMSALL